AFLTRECTRRKTGHRPWPTLYRSMSMPMMAVGHVGMGMPHARMNMAMAVRLTRRIGSRVRMAVVFVMDVAMIVLHRVMFMLMLVPLREMQPYPRTHEQAGSQERRRQRLR